MEKKYQIFISSTYEDLKNERKQVIEALLNANHIPAGMELFSASNDQQFEYIKKIIDNCDYYIVIIAGRYGSINPSSKLSYTEQEFDYALSKNIPILGFIHSDPENLHSSKRDDDKKNELHHFKEKVKDSRLCKYWSTPSDLLYNILNSLNQIISDYPQPGWIRGSKIDTTDLLSELNQLRKEKEKLSSDIYDLNKQLSSNQIDLIDLASGSDKFTLIATNRFIALYGDDEFEEDELELSWDEIFACVGPYLISSLTFHDFIEKLMDGLNSTYGKSYYYFNQNCAQTIKFQLAALKLISVKPVYSANNGYVESISLTEKGMQHLIKVKTIKSNSNQ